MFKTDTLVSYETGLTCAMVGVMATVFFTFSSCSSIAKLNIKHEINYWTVELRLCWIK